VNVLDEIPHLYSHQRNLELDQTRYIIETQDHEYVDSKVVILFSRVYALCEKEGHSIMDCHFVPFHNKVSITKYVELHNVARALMDQSQGQEPKIPIV